MFLLVPLRVENASVDRLPWVSIAIAALCLTLFTATWVLPENPRGVSDQEVAEVVEYWAERPWLELPDGFADRLLDRRAVARAEAARQEHQRTHPRAAPSDERKAEEQKYLDELAARAVELLEGSKLWRWALVPSRGLLQAGWVLHLFLHAGWLHLLGNLFFFYLTGPLLEDVWGRRFFAAFFLACGVLAAAAQVGASRGAMGMMVGASGAIAGCMGAFSRRMAGHEIRMGYLVFALTRLARGTFMVPAWLWGLVWFASEAWTFARGTAGSVAVVAHLGGFGAGFLVALWLEKSGIEARLLAPAIERATVYRQHEGIDEARAALARNDRAAAREAYTRVLRERPDDLEALGRLTGMRIEDGQPEEAMARLEPVLARLVRDRRDEAVAQLLIDAGQGVRLDLLPVRTLRPARASISRLGPAFDHLAELLDLELLRQQGPIGGRALLRQLERLLARHDAEGVGRLVREAEERVDLSPEIREKVAGLAHGARSERPLPAVEVAGAAPEPAPAPARPASFVAAAGVEPVAADLAVEPARRERSMDLPEAGPELEIVTSRLPGAEGLDRDLETGPAAAAAPAAGPPPLAASAAPAPLPPVPAAAASAGSNGGGAVRVLPCRLAELRDEGLLLATAGGRSRPLSWAELRAIGGGLVSAGEPPRLVLVTDLVVALGDAGSPPAAFRLSGAEHDLGRHFPGVQVKDAYGLLLRRLLERSGARPLLPDGVLARADVPRFGSLGAYNAALYGQLAAGADPTR